MKNLPFYVTAFVYSALTILLSSCKAQPKEQLILGEWQFQEPKLDKTGYDKNEVFVFFKSNVFWHGYHVGNNVTQKVIGDYSIKQNGKSLELVLVRKIDDSKASTEIIELTNETLILKAKVGTENLVLKKTKVFND